MGLSTLYAIALDHLPIQASAVPSKHIFSSSTAILMEALQIVKFSLKNDRLNFTEGLIMPECDMVDNMPEADLLGALLGNDPAAGMDAVIAAFGQDDKDD